jgi:CubicO group peptidase (beta-lactamase class C family)
MIPRTGLTLAWLSASLIATQCFAATNSIDSLLESIRAKSNVPALAAAVVRSNEVVAVGAVGVRKFGSPEKVTADDKFHIGSCTKAMTATLAAMYVEQGKLSWTSTVGERFPDWRELIHRDYANVTLEQLLSHRAGVPGDLNRIGVWSHVWQRSSQPPMEQRVALAKELLVMKPMFPPGTKNTYANAGYTIGGLMMERLEQRAWEDLIREKLFKPLGMASAGFGMPSSLDKVDQPWGHALKNGKLIPDPPGPSSDNPAAIGPGGTVHCSITDLARFANLHLQGERGGSTLLKAETFKKLHTPLEGQIYGFGWNVITRPWAKKRALTHNGSNTRNFTVMWLAPNLEFAVVVASNIGGTAGEKACDDAASKLIREFLE